MLTNEEKRALEIYITLIIQEIRRNNSRALHHIRYFFKSMEFFGNYNSEFLHKICLENLEIIEQQPSKLEMSLLFALNSNKLKFIKRNMKYLYHKNIYTSLLRENLFSEHPIKLHPKINDPNFHQELLTFLRNFAIISKTIPIIGDKK